MAHSPRSPQVSSALFFQANTALVPPYSILIDTNFFSHTIRAKLDLLPALMDCLYAKCIPVVTTCVMAELEKLSSKYRLALRVARDERWERLRCDHKGTYADDCIVDRVMKHRVYIVATNDKVGSSAAVSVNPFFRFLVMEFWGGGGGGGSDWTRI